MNEKKKLKIVKTERKKSYNKYVTITKNGKEKKKKSPVITKALPREDVLTGGLTKFPMKRASTHQLFRQFST